MLAVQFILCSVTDTFVIHIASVLKRLMVLKRCNSVTNASNLTTATGDQGLYMPTQPHATFWFEN